ncbi:glycosyltransferase family 4 protein [Flavobacterium sp. UBA6135]|uniref:glycosyltransferase family 4 protein n=1 Tax=Flavobacterium sp. UBA6135 TaxID=1946553 RepID=UPI0025BE7403|nr:glycosyltransferase family 4 protein [Flavobacterium sp. UBA6135]
MKVALYTGELPPPVFIDRLIHVLAKEGVELILFGAMKKKVSYAFPTITVVGYRGKAHKAWQLFKYTVLLLLFKAKAKKKLDKILAQQGRTGTLQKLKCYPVLYHQPDIFHLQWAKAIGDWMWVQEFGMKLVLSARGTHLTISPKVYTKYAESYVLHFSKVDAFHAVSKAIAKEVVSYGVSPELIYVAYSGLNLKNFTFKVKAASTKKIKILSIGRAHWVKGYSYAIEGVCLLKKNHVSFSYTIIGLDPNEELLFLRDQSGLDDCIQFKPYLSSDEVLEAIHQADVLLLPSVEEGIANVVLEAMALGTLVVTTACGGMTEVVTDGVNGFVVPVRDPKAIAAAIVKVSELALEDYQRMTKAARNTIEQNFTEQQMVTAMQKLYQSLEAHA